MVKGGAANSVRFCVGGTDVKTYLGEDGPNTKGKGGLLGYLDGGSGVEGICGGYQLKAEYQGRAP